jgi:hypothetical protein
MLRSGGSSGIYPSLEQSPVRRSPFSRLRQADVGKRTESDAGLLRFHLNRNSQYFFPDGPMRKTNPRTAGSETSRFLPSGRRPAIRVEVSLLADATLGLAVDTRWTLSIAMTYIVMRLFSTRECAERWFGNLPSPSRKRYKIRPIVATRCIWLRSVSKVLGCNRVGAWRSLVAHLLWEQRVGGSNPSAPTSQGGPFMTRNSSRGPPAISAYAIEEHGHALGAYGALAERGLFRRRPDGRSGMSLAAC